MGSMETENQFWDSGNFFQIGSEWEKHRKWLKKIGSEHWSGKYQAFDKKID